MKRLFYLVSCLCLTTATPALSDKRGDELIAGYLGQTARRSACLTLQVEQSSGSQPPIILAFTWMRRVQPKLTSHFIRIEAPPSEKGKLLLVHERPDGGADYTAYRPNSALGAKVRLSGARHYKYKSLRISVQELIGGELAKYTHHFLGSREVNGVACHLVENRLKPQFNRESEFSRSVLALSTDKHTLVQWELYDRSDSLKKKIEALETKDIDGVPTVTRARFTDPRTESQLLVRVLSIDYDPQFNHDVFQKANLSRHSH